MERESDEDEDSSDSWRDEAAPWRWLAEVPAGARPARLAVGLAKAFADVWVDALLALLPGAPPRTVSQLVYVCVALLTAWSLKALLSIITLAGTATLCVVCFARWRSYAAEETDECAA